MPRNIEKERLRESPVQNPLSTETDKISGTICAFRSEKGFSGNLLSGGSGLPHASNYQNMGPLMKAYIDERIVSEFVEELRPEVTGLPLEVVVKL